MAITVSKAPQVNKSKWNIDFIFVGHFKKIETGLIEKNDRLFLNLLRKAKSGLCGLFFQCNHEEFVYSDFGDSGV